MRTLPPRSSLPSDISRKLQSKTESIQRIPEAERKTKAARLYKSVRKADWFIPVIEALRVLSGKTERCMYCSGSESSNLEHFKPKAVFPELALTWENFLWICWLCNHNKDADFPLAADDKLINPLEEKVWNFFRIDEKGNLAPRRVMRLNGYHPRALSTMKIIKLDRQALQESRQRHLIRLKKHVSHVIRLYELGDLSKKELEDCVADWRDDAGQPDVADYFLNGPGRRKEPFAALFKLLS